jgi:proteic killer suppression protein
MAIVSFDVDDDAEKFFHGGKISKKVKWQQIKAGVQRKLDILNYAVELIDLLAPPGNRLEKLTGDLEGFFSIRINDQWRIIFHWTNDGPTDVKVIDDQ